MKLRNLIFALAFMGIAGNSFAGGGWTKAKGESYIKLSEWWLISDQHFTDLGKIDPNTTMGIFNTTLYLEYGITDRLTGIVFSPLLSRMYMNNVISGTTGETIIEGDAINSFGDTDVAFKYAITKKKRLALAGTLLFGLPTGNPEGGRDKNLQTGDGEFNQMLKVDFGYPFSIKKHGAYIAGYSGFNNRTNNFSDELRFGAELGVNLAKKKLWMISRLDIIESLKNGATAETAMTTSLFANNTEFTSFSLEAAYYVTDRLGVSASYAGAVRGEIIFASPSYSVGVFLDIKK